MADANGGPLLLPPEVPAPEAPIDASTADNVAVEEATEPFREPRGIYMLRVPRPAFDDAPLKKADADLSTCISKLKAINGKAQIKRVRFSFLDRGSVASDDRASQTAVLSDGWAAPASCQLSLRPLPPPWTGRG